MMRMLPYPTRRPQYAARRGLTLVELLLAVMITAMIGATVAAMLTAVSYGTDSSKDMRSLVARNKALSARISATLRGSTMVLDQGDGFIVLWVSDDDDDDAPSLLEIRRLDYDPAADALSSYTAPDGTTDVYYDLNDDFEAITDALMGTADFPQTLWGAGVGSWTLALDNADPQAATLVSYQVSLAAGDLSDTAIAAVGLRN